MTYLVADISNNLTADLAALKAQGVTAVYAKSSEGTSFKDWTYDSQRARAKALGLAWGAYHFAHTGINSPAAEAAYFLSCARPVPGDLLPVLDAEYGTGDGRWVAAFLSSLHAQMVARKLGPDVTGLQSLLYSGHWWLDSRNNGAVYPQVGSWVAAYQPLEPARLPGTSARVGWQFTDGGGKQDLSHFEFLPRIGVPKSSVPAKAAGAGAAAVVAAGSVTGGAAVHKPAPKPVPIVKPTTQTAPKPAPVVTRPTPSVPARPTSVPVIGGAHPSKASYTASITLRKAQSILGVKVTGHQSTSGNAAFGKLIHAKHTHAVGLEIDKLRKLFGLKLTGRTGTDLHNAWDTTNHLAGKA